MLLYLLVMGVGLILLVWSSDRFVLGASATASNLGVSPLIVGLTIVGVGTSAPEIIVAAMAAWQGNLGLAIGNAVGSNIANVGLIVGASALVAPLAVRSQTLKREFPLMFAVIVLAGMLLVDRDLGRADAAILLVAFLGLLALMVFIAMRARISDPLQDEFAREMPTSIGTAAAVGWGCIGLGVLLLSSRMIVWGAINVASALGVSDLIIGLTIVAVGTSLPELAASVMSVIKREPDIAIGNVIGSNMFNMLPVLALPGLIAPGGFEAAVLHRDFPVMLALCLALFGVGYGFHGPGRVTRWEGAALLLAFAAYQFFLYFSAI